MTQEDPRTIKDNIENVNCNLRKLNETLRSGFSAADYESASRQLHALSPSLETASAGLLAFAKARNPPDDPEPPCRNLP